MNQNLASVSFLVVLPFCLMVWDRFVFFFLLSLFVFTMFVLYEQHADQNESSDGGYFQIFIFNSLCS